MNRGDQKNPVIPADAGIQTTTVADETIARSSAIDSWIPASPESLPREAHWAMTE